MLASRLLSLLLLCSLAFIPRAALAADGNANTAVPNFELDIEPILAVAGCNSGPCHGKARGQNGFALSLLGFDHEFDYSAIVKEGRGRRVFPAAPDSSLLLKKASAQVPHGGGQKLPVGSPHYETMRKWIVAGMPRAPADAPTLVRIEVTPGPRPLKPKETEQLTVTAHYSDGAKRNVTELAAFQSSDTPIATVKPGGLITAGTLPGETVVMARYMGQISTWNVVIPFSGQIAHDKYAALPRQNFIDGLVWKKLEQVGVLPSPVANDSTFLRRVSLDIIGRLPTADEARAFLNDKSSNKRAKLIDSLLERTEYADFWANKWNDLLRPNPYHVGMKATMNIDAWLRDVFRANKPYDQFVRELLTAQGSTWHNGATVMFRDKRKPEELTTMVSQLFLGIRLECAKCHHHPFEVYGQDEFYSLAAYFSRVSFKGQGISAPISGGEEMIFKSLPGGRSQPVIHPVTGQTMSPKPLFGPAPELGDDDDPRLALVNWMTSDKHDYFASVQANRIWADLMGRGLVDPVDDLRATNPPSNPVLLKALADEFRKLKFDNKALIRTICNSYVYGLASLANESNIGDTRNHSRHYRVRLRGETLLDAVTDITGVYDSFSGMPANSRSTQIWTHRIDSQFLDAFGRPDPNQDPPCERTSDTTMAQTLHLMNAPGLHRKVTSDNGKIAKLATSDRTPAQIVEELYLLAYSRLPTDDESRKAVALYTGDKAQRRMLTEDLLWALINTPEFMFKD
jgi:hypothetical protein